MRVLTITPKRISRLEDIELDEPVTVTGTMGLWDGPRPVRAVIHPDTLGDILHQPAWRNMDHYQWTIDKDNDLRFTGHHHDGTNTCVYRINKDTKLGPMIRDILNGK